MDTINEKFDKIKVTEEIPSIDYKKLYIEAEEKEERSTGS
jgi:hypothetical protein